MMAKPIKIPKIGKIFLGFTGICIIALPLIVLSATGSGPEAPVTTIAQNQGMDFDHNGQAIFENYDQIASAYIKGTSTQRTLAEYYALRQYPGSPPYIPHKVEDEKTALVSCLACHAQGGWTEELKRHTPVTPHPENLACRQCHVKMDTDNLFVENEWMSVSPPRLGRSYLPGSPPPVPHTLQLRGNCAACHVGPGAVVPLRVEHPSRGNCRQCHVPDTHMGLFAR